MYICHRLLKVSQKRCYNEAIWRGQLLPNLLIDMRNTKWKTSCGKSRIQSTPRLESLPKQNFSFVCCILLTILHEFLFCYLQNEIFSKIIIFYLYCMSSKCWVAHLQFCLKLFDDEKFHPGMTKRYSVSK